MACWVPALLLALACAVPAAWADDLADVKAELGATTDELASMTEQVASSGERVAALEDEIDGLLDDIAGRQATRSGLQQRMFDLSRAMYKNGDQLNIAAIVTNAESLSQVMEQVELRRKVLSEYARLAEEQGRVSAELEVTYRKVSAQKDEQAAELADLKERQAQLGEAVAALQGRADELTAAEEAALAAAAEAQRQAEEAAAAAEVATPEPQPADDGQPASREADAAANPTDGADVRKAAAEKARKEQETREAKEAREAEEAARAAEAEQAAAERAAAEQAAAEAAASGWQTGAASAYGGSSDSSTGAVSTTATGATCDDWSMGVAVPIAWGPAAYYGRSVEISYGGATVVATVNDCGGMGGGSRSLDLQPGVFKALGASSCQEWGVREVQYRFL